MLNTADTLTFNETCRPQFHFTAQRGWINDPNGLVYLNGQYHLFHQHAPDATWHPWLNGSAMHWGHAVSDDLVHWRHWPAAIDPDDNGRCFSGSAVVSRGGPSAFEAGALVAYYTGTKTGQCIAYSVDGGRTFEKFASNPALPGRGEPDRDPKVFWHESTGRWVMVLYHQRDGSPIGDFVFYVSDDLVNWSPRSRLEGWHECPDLFELPVEDDPAQTMWVLHGADGAYALGDFDGQAFTPRTGRRMMDCGSAFYAAQTFNDMPVDDGRRVQIAWMATCRHNLYPDMPFCQQHTFPCELTLQRIGGRVTLCRRPVREIEKLHVESHVMHDEMIGCGDNPLDGIDHDLLHMVLDIEPRGADMIGLDTGAVQMRYTPVDRRITLDACSATLPCEGERVSLEMLIDRTSVELYAAGGAVSLSHCHVAERQPRRSVLWSTGGEACIHRLEVHLLRSALR